MPAVFFATLSAGASFGAATVAAIGSLTTTLVGRLLITVALSALQAATVKAPRTPGIKTEATLSGGTVSQRFIVGRYATAGTLIAPPCSYGNAGSTPLAYLVYPIALSILPGCTLQRVILNDEYIELGSPAATWGRPATGDMAAYVSIDYRDGTQTTAHADMLTAFGADPDRPWLSDMVGPGTCYTISKFRYNRERFNGLPGVRFEMLGTPMYDPRADSTVGGSGAQRWSDPTTWEQTENLVVIIYNIMRGIDVGAGLIWGGGCEAEDLPLDSWFAGMNACDLAVDAPGGGTEPQFRGGFEIALEDEPASVIEELKKACMATMVEIGGIWKIRVGGPGLPSYFMTDADIVVTKDHQFDPFPGLSETFNGITAAHPEPASLWESTDAPARYSAEWEAEDGDRRLLASLSLPACPYASQVQRLMAAYIADHRRFRRHNFALPPEAAVLEPLDSISWTSQRYGYTAKVFEVDAASDSLMTMYQAISVRERDSGDFVWAVEDYLPVTLPPVGTTAPVTQTVPDFAVSAVTLTDSAAADRRPAIRLDWDGDGADDATGLAWEIRLAGGTDAVLTGTHGNFAAGFTVISAGIIAGEDYEVRARPVVNRATVWTDWEPVTAPVVLITATDIKVGAVSRQYTMRVGSGVLTSGSPTKTLTWKDPVDATEPLFAAQDLDASGLITNPILSHFEIGLCRNTSAGISSGRSRVDVVVEYATIADPTTWANLYGTGEYSTISLCADAPEGFPERQSGTIMHFGAGTAIDLDQIGNIRVQFTLAATSVQSVHYGMGAHIQQVSK